MISKEQAYEQATMQSIANDPNGTRMDVIYKAMESYAEAKSRELAIEFDEWKIKNNWMPYMKGVWYRGMGTKNYESKNGIELLELFIKSKQ